MLNLCELAETIIAINLEKGGKYFFFLELILFLKVLQNYFLLIHLRVASSE